MTEARLRLEQVYGGPLPPALSELTEDQHARLAGAIDAALDRQSEALRKATDNGLDFIPRLLRGPIKKVLFG